MRYFNLAIVEDDPIYSRMLKHKLSLDSEYNISIYDTAR